ncbi:MAG: orotate phosphoribosyltransferase [Spirochaetaceae bacterium]|jgi:orotate phosphoribosyltransferase|nr:orotate phosphoribosyltransferase [Spirochaetaceae bacterium]
MNVVETLKTCGALLEGHFLLSSGRHSDKYFQCARLFQYPDKAQQILAPVAGQIASSIKNSELRLDAVVGPALGGVIAAYELGRILGIRAFFTERGDNGVMTLRRGFEVHEGMNIVIAEDVVTTGKSSLEAAAVVEALGGRIIAIACAVDRRADNIQFEIPLYAACRIAAENWDVQDCPLCAQDIPFIKPGSRKFPL